MELLDGLKYLSQKFSWYMSYVNISLPLPPKFSQILHASLVERDSPVRASLPNPYH